jgi:asparagine synthase (glutamine-hydrolysing)
VLDGSTSFVVDHDACWACDGPVDATQRWEAILSEGRLGEVEGAFALARRGPDGSLLLARDGLGERTLFYAFLPGGGVVFASTLRALHATGLLAPELNLPAVGAYLSYAYVPGRQTLAAGVHEVLPGEILRFGSEGGEPARDRLWSLPAEPESEEGEDELRLRLRARLEGAVLRRLPPGEPVGAFLSGGVDTSLVVALARRLHDAPVRTFSVSFGEGYPNELPFSSMVAEHCRTDHTIVELSPEVVLHHLDDAIGLLNDPIGDPLTVPNALLFREAAAETGVVLNGEGGDPCFGGPKNLPMLLAELLGDGANEAADPLARERSYLRAHQKCYDDLPAMLTARVREALARAPLEPRLTPHFTDPRWRRFVTKLMALNVAFKGAHHILGKVDAVSAPFGVRPRSPLFDRGVVETAFEVPPSLKLRGSVEKYVLKQAVADLLPPAIIERPKSGMLVPVEGWFQGPLLAQAKERLLDGLAPWDLVELAWLERLLSGRLPGLRPRRGVKIWLLVTLESWLRTVLGTVPRKA